MGYKNLVGNIKWTKNVKNFLLELLIQVSCIVIRRRGFKLITKSLEFLNYDEWFILEVSCMGMVFNSSRYIY